jgi:hypothetical protein
VWCCEIVREPRAFKCSKGFNVPHTSTLFYWDFKYLQRVACLSRIYESNALQYFGFLTSFQKCCRLRHLFWGSHFNRILGTRLGQRKSLGPRSPLEIRYPQNPMVAHDFSIEICIYIYNNNIYTYNIYYMIWYDII